MPNTGINPVPPWGPNQPLDHRRLNAGEARAVTDFTVGPGLEMKRLGNAVSVGLVKGGSQIDRAVVVKISGNAPGGGQYTGAILREPASATGIGPLVMPAGMTEPVTGDDALILHPAETLTHDLSPGTYAIGRIVGVVPNGI